MNAPGSVNDNSQNVENLKLPSTETCINKLECIYITDSFLVIRKDKVPINIRMCLNPENIQLNESRQIQNTIHIMVPLILLSHTSKLRDTEIDECLPETSEWEEIGVWVFILG